MAKISARGATAVERLECEDAQYVLTSDGRVLVKHRYSGGAWSNYNVLARNITKEVWANFKRRLRA